ncbi:MAG: sugar ABC transporter permease [Chloroflexi bacterium]|nr:sugar ABC transporter permease [Chloroflexota bacterium]
MKQQRALKKPTRWGAQEERFGWLFIAPMMLYVAIVFFIPLLFMVFLTVFRWSPIDGSSPFVGLMMIKQALTDRLWWLSLANSAKFMALSVPATVILSLLSAVAFASRSRLPLKGLFKTLYFLPLVTSLAVTAFIWLWIFNPDYGFFNSLLRALHLPTLLWLADTEQVIPSLVIVFVWARLGFEMAIFLSGIESIPHEFYEAAKIDGAGSIQSFFRITLPLLNPQIVLVGVLEVIAGLKVFELPYVATAGGPVNASRVAVMHIYESAFRYLEFSKASVAALILFLLIVLVTLIQMRLTQRRFEY